MTWFFCLALPWVYLNKPLTFVLLVVKLEYCTRGIVRMNKLLGSSSFVDPRMSGKPSFKIFFKSMSMYMNNMYYSLLSGAPVPQSCARIKATPVFLGGRRRELRPITFLNGKLLTQNPFSMKTISCEILSPCLSLLAFFPRIGNSSKRIFLKL